MKKWLAMIMCLVTIGGLEAQTLTPSSLTDTGQIRFFINQNIVPNGTKSISALQMNTLLNGYLNAWPRSADSTKFLTWWRADQRYMPIGSQFNLNPATGTTLGGVKITGTDGINVDANGKLSLPKLTTGSVPFIGTDGYLTEDVNGLQYVGGDLYVGQNSSTLLKGIHINGDKASILAGQTGTNIRLGNTTGDDDLTKSFNILNNGRSYLNLTTTGNTGNPSTFQRYANFNTHVLPTISNAFNLGDATHQWLSTYTKNLYINGQIFLNGSSTPTTFLDSLYRTSPTVNTLTATKNGALYNIDVTPYAPDFLSFSDGVVTTGNPQYTNGSMSKYYMEQRDDNRIYKFPKSTRSVTEITGNNATVGASRDPFEYYILGSGAGITNVNVSSDNASGFGNAREINLVNVSGTPINITFLNSKLAPEVNGLSTSSTGMLSSLSLPAAKTLRLVSTSQGGGSGLRWIPSGMVDNRTSSTSTAFNLAGGTTGYVLKKNSNTDYDWSWQPDAVGSGTGGTGTVTEVDPTVPQVAKNLTVADSIRWSNMVAKVAGMALSHNDYTDVDKTAVGTIGSKLDKITIVGGTGTKITANNNGLVTAIAQATTADIASSLDKRYVTDAQLTKIDAALIKTNNLSDLTDVPTARTNLGLGTLATQSGTLTGSNTGDDKTTVIGIHKGVVGNANVQSATVGVDYTGGTNTIGNGIVKNTVTAGVGQLGIASASDFPTLNQNTTGTAGNITGILNATSMPALIGDVTTTTGGVTTTIAPSAVTATKIRDTTITDAKIKTVDAAKITTGLLAKQRIGAFGGDVSKVSGDSVLTISNLDVTKIGTGLITTSEFNFLDGTTSAIQTQLNAKAALASPTFTGTVTIPTPAATDNTTKAASTAYVTTRASQIVHDSLQVIGQLILDTATTGIPVVTAPNDTTFKAKSLIAGTNVTLTKTDSTIIINASGTGGTGSITVDQTVTQGSVNAVSGGAVYNSLNLKANADNASLTGSTVMSDNANATTLTVTNPSLTTSEAMQILGPVSTGTANGKAFSVGTAADNYSRGMFYTDGSYGIGGGASTRDVYISRPGAGQIRISGDKNSAAADLAITGDVTIGGSSVPPTGVALNMLSTTGGFLMPRLTQAQITALGTALPDQMLVCQSDGSKGVYQYDLATTSWKMIGGSASSITFDTTPTAGSGNAVTSSGISNALDLKPNLTGNNVFKSGRIGIGGLNDSQYQLAVSGGATTIERLQSQNALGGILKLENINLPTAAGTRLFEIGFGVTSESTSAKVAAYSESAFSSGTSLPTYLSFQTTASPTTAVTERMRITGDGNIWITNPTLPTIPNTFLHGIGWTTGSNNPSASLTALSDGAHTASSLPTYLSLATTPSGSVTNTERVRITSDGKITNTQSNGNANAVVDFSASQGKGFLPPLVSAAQRTALTGPNGLVVYQTDGTAGLYVYQPTGWQLLGGSVSNITIDATPTSGSTNAVSSGGTYDALALKPNLAGNNSFTGGYMNVGGINNTTYRFALTTGSTTVAELQSQHVNGGILKLETTTLPSTAGTRLFEQSFGVASQNVSAKIAAYSDGAFTSGASLPAYLSFQTTAVGSPTVTERIRMTSDGSQWFMNPTLPAASDVFLHGIGWSTGSNFPTASITALSGGAHTATSLPTYLSLATTTTGSTVNTERYRITADGKLTNTSTNGDASAVVDLSNSQGKGILIPKVNQAQRLAIVSPADGLMVYQTDGVNGIWNYRGNKWENLRGSGMYSEYSNQANYTVDPNNGMFQMITLNVPAAGGGNFNFPSNAVAPDGMTIEVNHIGGTITLSTLGYFTDGSFMTTMNGQGARNTFMFDKTANKWMVIQR